MLLDWGGEQQKDGGPVLLTLVSTVIDVTLLESDLRIGSAGNHRVAYIPLEPLKLPGIRTLLSDLRSRMQPKPSGPLHPHTDLLALLDEGLASTESLQAVAENALRALSEERLRDLNRWLDNKEYTRITAELIAACFWSKAIRRTGAVLQDENGKAVQGVTYGVCEGVALCGLHPIDQPHRLRTSPSEPQCRVVRAYPMFLLWLRKLVATGNAPALADSVLGSSWDFSLHWQQRESVDAATLLRKVYAMRALQMRDTFNLSEVVPLRPGGQGMLYNGYELQVPGLNACWQLHHSGFLSKQEDVQEALRRLEDDSSAAPFAHWGSGMESGRDWWLIFRVSRNEHGDGMRWLLVHGHSKHLDRIGQQPDNLASVLDEKAKSYNQLGSSVASLFVYVTDAKVPAVDDPAVVVIGAKQHQAFYGPVGAMRRKLISQAACSMRASC